MISVLARKILLPDGRMEVRLKYYENNTTWTPDGKKNKTRRYHDDSQPTSPLAWCPGWLRAPPTLTSTASQAGPHQRQLKLQTPWQAETCWGKGWAPAPADRCFSTKKSTIKLMKLFCFNVQFGLLNY